MLGTLRMAAAPRRIVSPSSVGGMAGCLSRASAPVLVGPSLAEPTATRHHVLLSSGRSWKTGAIIMLPGVSQGRCLSARQVSWSDPRRVMVTNMAVPDSRASATTATPTAPPMFTSELPKTFGGKETEERLYQWWESSGFFEPDCSAPGEPFAMSMPPPNVTGRLHMGHAMTVALEDIIARYYRMKGRKVLYLPGIDHAGIATQLVVEKMLAAEGVKRLDLGRDAFVAKVWEWKEKYGGAIASQQRYLGASCDWSRSRFTLDEGLSKAVAEAFFQLHSKGLIYRGSYMVNWSPNLQTAVSDLEVEYSEEPGQLYFFKYPLAGDSGAYIPIATTRPETLLGDTAVAVHPEDERYKQFIGLKVVVPMSGGRQIPVIGDEYVDREFGTGALKITPGHDPNDYEIGQRVGLPIINIMNKDGTLNENAGAYRNMDRFAVRKKLWSDMEAAGLTLKMEPYTLRVPRSQRGGEVVEPLVSKQWFVKMESLAKPALAAVQKGDIKIVPERFEKVYNFWLENIKDWCISRQLWWGHRIPVWYVDGSNEEQLVVARSEEEAYSIARKKHGSNVRLTQEQDVLDTWFSSGLWPFSTLGWPQSTADLATFFPNNVMETGHDILFFWVARMIMMSMELTGKIPFETVYLHGLVRDAQGRKMSKSLGNVIDPLELCGQYGTDALRFTLATGTTPGQDVNLSLERMDSNRNFTNKVWNAAKYVLFQLSSLPQEQRGALVGVEINTEAALAELGLAERWVVSALHRTIDSVNACFDRMDYGEAGRQLYEFLWSDFADWYIEASKTRMQDPAAAAGARRSLVYVMETVLRLLHPFMPFITEELWQALPHKGQTIMRAPWPSSGLPVDTQAIARFESLQALIRCVRNLRSEYNVDVGKKVPATVLATTEVTRQDVQSERAILGLLARMDLDRLQVCDKYTGKQDG
eukprot:jgi/Mesvir1/7216/Mv19035-RA.2